MSKFIISNWQSIISIISFVISVYVFITTQLSKRTNLKINIIRTWLVGNKSLYALVTLTNNSSIPISIVHAEFNNIYAFRSNHHFMHSKTTNIDTSTFPIALIAHETKDILIEFVSSNDWETNSTHKLILHTSRKNKKININLSDVMIPIEQSEKELQREMITNR